MLNAIVSVRGIICIRARHVRSYSIWVIITLLLSLLSSVHSQSSGRFAPRLDGPVLDWKRSNLNITFTMTIPGPVAWMSVGISPQERGLMYGADVSMAAFGTTMRSFRVTLNGGTSNNEDSAFARVADEETDQRIVYENGYSIFQCTRPLTANARKQQLPVQDGSMLVWAWRKSAPSSNEFWGKHEGTGSARLRFSSGQSKRLLRPIDAPALPRGATSFAIASDGEQSLSIPAQQNFQTIIVDSKFMFEYALDTTENTFRCRAELKGSAWLSIGFSKSLSEENAMIPSEAVIGLPTSERESALESHTYAIKSYSPEEILNSRIDTNTGSVKQKNELTVLEFKRKLSGSDLTTIRIGQPVNVIWAYGKSNDFGKHARAGSTVFLLGGMCNEEKDCPTGSKCSQSTCVSRAASGRRRKVKESLWHTINTGSSIDITYLMGQSDIEFKAAIPGNKWLSIGLSEKGSMAPAWAVIGEPDQSRPREVIISGKTMESIADTENSMLTSGSVSYQNDMTLLEFRRPLHSPEDSPAFHNIETDGTSHVIFAYGRSAKFGPHAYDACGSVTVQWQSGDVIAGGFIANGGKSIHGALMLISWLVLVPLGIYSACFLKDSTGSWFTKHKTFMVSGLVFTALGFALIVTAVHKSGSAHFVSAHARIGLLITLVGMIHPVIARYRNNNRPLWTIQHKWTGRLLYVFALVNSLLGVKHLHSSSSRMIFSSLIFVLVVAFLIVCVRAIMAVLSKNMDEKTHADDDKLSNAPKKMPWSPSESDSGLPSWAQSAIKADQMPSFN